MADYTPLPQHLEDHVWTLVAEFNDQQRSASNTIFVITQVLGKAYASGHRDGYNHARSMRAVEDELKPTVKKSAG